MQFVGVPDKQNLPGCLLFTSSLLKVGGQAGGLACWPRAAAGVRAPCVLSGGLSSGHVPFTDLNPGVVPVGQAFLALANSCFGAVLCFIGY